MALAYDYKDIELSVVKNLNTTILNKAFIKCIANDKSCIPACNYIPTIWENKWYNNDSIAGYDIGDTVWRYTYIHLSDFLSSYGDRVYTYAQDKDRLMSYLISSWTLITSSTIPDAEKVIWENRYWNVISGYSETTTWEEWDPKLTTWVTHSGTRQIYQPLFDYGARDSEILPRIEIYSSTKTNNKDLLSSSTWKKVVLSSQEEYDNYISNEICLLFEDHLKNYHLAGQLTESEVSTLLLANNLSNFDFNSVDSTINLRTHDQYINTLGLDIVRKFVKKCTNNVIGSKIVKTYQWFRYWNSGYLEHGGIVSCQPIVKDTLSPSDFSLCINFDWILPSTGETAFIYDYPETTELFYGSDYNELNYSDSVGGTEHMSITAEKYLIGDRHYTVQVTPILTDVLLDVGSDNKYLDFSTLKTRSYPEEYSLSNKNHPYLNVEIHHMKNNSFCITRNNIDDDLSSNSQALFYSYYVTGFRVKK